MSQPDQEQSRRSFIVKSAQYVAAATAVGQLTACTTGKQTATVTFPSRVVGANERINMAVIGIRSRGAQHMKNFANIPNVHIKTIVDIDENLYANAIRGIEKLQDVPPSTEYDLRRVFDDPDIDAVSIATPDHWHSLAAIWACQAGKHVYLEKPCSHTIWEGRKTIEASRKYNRIVAAGFQNRSIDNVRRAMKFLHDGKLGEIYMAKGLCFKPRESIGHKKNEPVPPGVHYDLWLGCAPDRPFNRNHFHYEWHWNWTYGCGDIGNQGPHQFDIARWGLNKHEHPVKVSSQGGYFKWDCDQQTPNTQTATLEYADGKLLQFEVRGLYTNDEHGVRIGNLFFGTEGWMYVNGSTWKTYFGRKNEPGPGSDTKEESADPMNLAGAGGGNHFENFIKAVRSGNTDDLNCHIAIGHVSTALPHLANIAYRTGRTLTFDGSTERFTNDREANAYLTKKYRKPYVVPHRV